HDDLPAMDNDDYRRGKLTNHKVFGEATAILAGDALLTLAFETVAAADLPPATIAEQVRELARAAGALGMVGGQMADLLAQGKTLTEAELRAVHARKTGALLTASVVIGAHAAELSADKLAHLRAYGDCIGLAFQIVDDILDVAGDAAVLGKATGGDVAAGKATYPGLMGLEESRRQAAELVRQAQERIDQAQLPQGQYLQELAAYIIRRDH
ncbi:MAG: polyprenyl synthetase family protein, partial [Firmicutes bacterium]|nr:polyprenyl synthetase family protein [Bacillota bacterium]